MHTFCPATRPVVVAHSDMTFKLSDMNSKDNKTLTVCAAGHGGEGGDGSGWTEPLSLWSALLPSGALLQDFDHSVLLQELSVKYTDPESTKHIRIKHF